MLDWQLAYLGRRTFPADITDFELREAFTFTAQEQSDIRDSFRSRLRISPATELRAPERQHAEHRRARVLHHLAQQFAVQAPDLATLRSLYRRKKSRRAHRRWVINYEGFRALDADGLPKLPAYICERTRACAHRQDLGADVPVELQVTVSLHRRQQNGTSAIKRLPHTRSEASQSTISAALEASS